MNINKIYNEDCIETMKKMDKIIDLVFTLPPYNMTKRKGGYADKQKRYDSYKDWKTPEEYINWSIEIFNLYDKVIKNNGCILYNFSYSIENPSLPYILISDIIKNTNWTIADTIIWKKNNAIPHPASYNRLNRITEFVWVFCRKNEINSFNMNKEVKKISPKGQKYYEIIDNFLVAPNNDKSCDLNKATFSSELVYKLISKYCQKGSLIYDNFMGTGTTAIGALMHECNYIGSETNIEQCKYTENRIIEYKNKAL